MFTFFGVPVDAAYHVVSGFTGILAPVLGGAAAVAAIIAVTIAVRIVLMPLSLRAFRAQAAAARLAPQLLALRQRYAKQPERLQSEMSALYRQEGTSMFASIKPLLFQWPFLSVMYLLFRSPLIAGKPNTLLADDLLGAPLGGHWLSGAGPASIQGGVFLGLFALLAALCWLSSRLGQLMAAPAVPAVAPALPAVAPAGPAVAPAVAPAAGRSGSSRTDPATAAPAPRGTGVLVKALPYLTVVIAAFAPLAAGIYLLTSMGWSLVERRFFFRGPAGSQRDQGAQQPDRR
jgi:YidC/Oxa1 family membrane protein insertase